MQAGRLRHRVKVQEKSASRDAYNAEVVTWTTLYDAWAAIEPISGREYIEAHMGGAEVTHRVMMRYRPGVTPEMRVVSGERVFAIVSVLDRDERHAELTLMCKENPHG